jgi:hypothetical protein
MSRSRRITRWTAAALLAGAVGIAATGCVAVPLGGGYGYGYGEPSVVFPAPSVFIGPTYGHRHGHYRGHYRGHSYGHRGHRWGR